MTQNGRDAEELIARKYGLEPFAPRWADLRHPTTGAVYEVKSAQRDREFRLWEDQHRSLRASDNAGNTAYYAFVTDDGSTYRVRRVHTVSDVIRDRGGWNKSGHRRDARQLKIPVEVLI